MGNATIRKKPLVGRTSRIIKPESPKSRPFNALIVYLRERLPFSNLVTLAQGPWTSDAPDDWERCGGRSGPIPVAHSKRLGKLNELGVPGGSTPSNFCGCRLGPLHRM
jgi:hypothetical protein